MPHLPAFTSVLDISYGEDPVLDAWLLHFMTYNNLGYAIDPEKNASPEQIRFMVFLEDDTFFAPCSDWMLHHLLNNWLDPELLREYGRKWRAVVKLVKEFVPDRDTRRVILGLCRYKFGMVRHSPIIIPSRLVKWFITIFLTLSGLTDPFREDRALANELANKAIESGAASRLVDVCPEKAPACVSLKELRYELDVLELSRLLVLSTREEFWTGEGGDHSVEELEGAITESLEKFAAIRRMFGQTSDRFMKILFLPDTSGGLIFDLLVIRSLLRQGHKVILTLKEGFYFNSPAYWDWEHDPVLADSLEGAYFSHDQNMSKNELLRLQREHNFVVISDGTREELNFYRTSVTFSRAWKEADLVLAKGKPHYRRLIQTSHRFTRDIVCYFSDDMGKFQLYCKPKPEEVRKFTEKNLLDMAEAIIHWMRKAKADGKSVMFYSAIIGSIPGQTKTALSILNTFVAHLRQRLENTYIVNPGEHFEEGLDADDLMYMWEHVQRSGLIDFWRFQTVEDIEKSFEILGRRVPSFWAGKDATFSTGCTKEMEIALDVQKRNPEMQILGPSPEKFFRRREYGVGKFCDAAISCK